MRSGMAFALYSCMTINTNPEKEAEWQKLCELIAHESDPQRLSKLVDQLIHHLDSRQRALRKTTEPSKPAANDK